MKVTRPDFAIASSLLATKLRILRERAELSQADLAQASGMSRSMIQKIEQGVQFGSRTTHRRLAAALNVPVNLLLSSEPLPPEGTTTLPSSGVEALPEADQSIADLASAADIHSFATWLAARQPTQLDLARIRKLAQLYFRED